MVEPSSFFNRLATREGFNASVKHINRTLELLDTCNSKKNLADNINSLLTVKELESEEVQSAVNMLLVEKWGYTAVSRNVTAVPALASLIAPETAKWKAIDLIIGYHHPDVGFIVLNPKNPETADIISGFRKNELIVLYAGTQEKTVNSKKNAELALGCLLDLIEDRKTKVPAYLLNGSYTFTAPRKPASGKVSGGKTGGKAARPVKPAARAPAARSSVSTGSASSQASAPVAAPPPVVESAAVPGQSKMSPLQSVVVTNELFHNGNVEAWKRIIRSYNAKYPGLQVFIYYDGERIIDINTLFKWGKVKHGTCIQFRVSGDGIQDLAKLSRYFRQGASNQFEAFLHGSPDTVMSLF